MTQPAHAAEAAFPGCLFVVSAPSGAGKSSLVKALLQREPQIMLSVSYTTRAPRPGEVDGTHYNFTTVEDFKAKRDRNEFLEWAEVHGNFYGTHKPWIEAQMQTGRDVLLEIDWQGAEQVFTLFNNAVGVFILPPSLPELERRLRGRGTDADEVIQRRLAAAKTEVSHAPEFDFVIINTDFDTALNQFQAVVEASRNRYSTQRSRQTELFRHWDLA